MAFVLASLNNLQVCAADVSTAFLYGKTREKVYIVAGEEFGDDAGKVMIVEGGCYGLKTSAARFHERVSEELRSMGFRPSKADFDLWMRPKADHYEYVATYVDDIMVFSKDCMKIIDRIKKVFDLKQIGTPEYYLGGNFHTISEAPNTLEAGNEDPQHHLSEKWLKEDVNMACSAKTYIENSIKRLETSFGKEFSKYNSPVHEALHPELDSSPLLNPADHSRYRTLIGCANWIVTLGRFDIAYATNLFSRFSQSPREGHLDGLREVFGYLKSYPKCCIIIDHKYSDHDQFNIEKHEQWKGFYPDAEEDISHKDMVPNFLGKKNQNHSI